MSNTLEQEYRRGFVAALTLFAWWKDGVQYVGTCGTTLQKAIEELVPEWHPQPQTIEGITGLWMVIREATHYMRERFIYLRNPLGAGPRVWACQHCGGTGTAEGEGAKDRESAGQGIIHAKDCLVGKLEGVMRLQWKERTR